MNVTGTTPYKLRQEMVDGAARIEQRQSAESAVRYKHLVGCHWLWRFQSGCAAWCRLWHHCGYSRTTRFSADDERLENSTELESNVECLMLNENPSAAPSAELDRHTALGRHPDTECHAGLRPSISMTKF